MKKNIYFWAPFIEKVGTEKAVINSAISLSSSLKYNCHLINSCGEYDPYLNTLKKKNIKIISLYKKSFIKKLPKNGFIASRLSYIIIFLFSFIPVIKLFKKTKNAYCFAYLITSLPLIIKFLFKSKIKIIIRISGKIKFNWLRLFFWKLTSNNVEKYLLQTKEYYNFIKKKFSSTVVAKKLYFVEDPIINFNEIKKKIVIRNKFKKLKFYIAIGRFTKQKNFFFLVKCFSIIQKKYPSLNLVILGDGEQKEEINKFIKQNNLQNKIHLLGYKKNKYDYIKKSLGLICTSIWEEPGFVIQEAAAAKKIILTSDCPSGPAEFLNYGLSGFVFKSNNVSSFLKKFDMMHKINSQKRKKFIKINYLSAKAYTKKNYQKNISYLLK